MITDIDNVDTSDMDTIIHQGGAVGSHMGGIYY